LVVVWFGGVVSHPDDAHTSLWSTFMKEGAPVNVGSGEPFSHVFIEVAETRRKLGGSRCVNGGRYGVAFTVLAFC
ncbi:hypothetical protein GOODEAATRI_034435, partial [Goodea atripinnis]